MQYDLTALAISMAYPNNKVIIDDDGIPSIFVYFKKQKLSDLLNTSDNSTHPAFIVNGKEIDGFWMGKYLTSVNGGKFASLPAMDPAHDIQHQDLVKRSFDKGKGWHTTTLAEWAFIALYCKKNGYIPLGNTNYGRDDSETLYQAIPSSYDNGQTGRTLTGTGPKSWYHNNDMSGVADLTGNVWEAVSGFRTVYGEIQVLPNNDASDVDNPMNETSTLWKAIDATTGEFVTPENTVSMKLEDTYSHAKTVKLAFDSSANKWYYTNQLSADKVKDGHWCAFADVYAAETVKDTAKLKLRALTLLPDDGASSSDYGSDSIGLNNNQAERIAWKGGNWGNRSSAGPFHLNAFGSRSAGRWDSGARLAYREDNQ